MWACWRVAIHTVKPTHSIEYTFSHSNILRFPSKIGTTPKDGVETVEEF